MNKRTTLRDIFYKDMIENTKNYETIFLTIHYDEWKNRIAQTIMHNGISKILD